MPGWLLRDMKPGEWVSLTLGEKAVAEIRVTQDRRGRLKVGIRAHQCITLRHEAAPFQEPPPCPDPSSSTSAQ